MEINEIELTYKDTDLLKQYYKLLTDEFKDSNELDTFDNLVYRLKNKENPDITVVKVYLNEDKEMLAGIIYDYYEPIQSIGLQFIIVNPKFRKQDIGKIVYKRMTSVYTYHLKFVFIEVDKSGYSKPFWEKLGFKDTKMLYIQPALEGKLPCDYFELWVKEYNNSVLNKRNIDNFIEYYDKYAIELPKKKESIPQ